MTPPRSTAIASEQRRLGAYYTPSPLSRLIAEWAIRSSKDRVLDPSFGACSFLVAARETLKSKGAGSPDGQVFGVDIDRRALAFASATLAEEHLASNIRIADFLQLSPWLLGPERFAAVIGNPPYIRHQWLEPQATQKLRASLEDLGFKLGGVSNSWAYFISHSVGFLKVGARLGFVLPGSALDVTYGRNLFEALAAKFHEIRLVRVLARLFPDTTEQSVIMLADGFGTGPGAVRYDQVNDLEGLAQLFAAMSVRSSMPIPVASAWKAAVAPRALEVWNKVAASSRSAKLGEVARISIGSVTGANAFFVRTADDTAFLRCPSVSIVAHARYVTTSLWSRDRQRALERAPARSRLLIIPANRRLHSPALARAISEAEKAGISERFKCSLRDPWYSLDDARVPDAFLPYMFASPRGISVNNAKATSTNSLHRLWWSTPDSRTMHILTTWSSLFVFGLELLGRSYGGGVLKIEPAVARELLLASNGTPFVGFAAHERLLRAQRPAEARQLADQLILREHCELSSAEVKALVLGATALQRTRVTL